MTDTDPARMSNLPHELAVEYHTLNRDFHRINAAGINVDDPAFEKLKKGRLALKDNIIDA